MSKRGVSLSEVMGKAGAEHAKAGLKLEHLPEVLGDAMPELPKNAVGRYRLLRSLKARFGPNFRSIPGVMDLLKQFDGVVSTELQVQKIRSIKAKAPKG